ncbi:helix-turn-helix transcriptional regulator [Amycolatopsis tolypomycina]|uniref:Predicted DNA-binding transcriptional regulator YafY, contains an HTH and WYL domains n=1 Tax=Amycolatopsis tolypomycina TaxID=208445 RepID=A0A1H5CJ75_9PSEU|nr:WYL domain-containing protein [Amycolatopsis tolypomycina]SED66474.1 Predicted DNA-binding transcriptional regulator YafY, contains an HTH and WYL domains [Amycolatopsis tolypomycina]
MPNPTSRLLALLTLLQTRPSWTGAELVERLEVSSRTVRYDIRKLRDLGYPVEAIPGVAGGYRLRAGTAMPPLQLDDDEAVAIAIALRTATGNAELGQAAGTALVKLEQVLPRRLRGRVAAMRQHTEAARSSGGVDPDLLVFLAGACRDHRRVRFGYQGNRREVEPHRVVQVGRRWYLVAFDPARAGWRQFRLDRMTVQRPEGARFVPREAPSAADVVRGIDAVFARHRAVVLVDAPAAEITARVPPAVPVEWVDERRCRVHATGESPGALALNLLMLDADFVVEKSSAELDAALDTLRRRLDGGR